MIKFRTAAVFSALALGIIATPSFAITNASECQSEGGEMVNVKNSDYCLVPIRPEEYADAAYDGNQLGVVDCPGDKLNDGKYCMYPVTIRAEKKAASTVSSPSALTDVASDVASETVGETTTEAATESLTIAPAKEMTSAEKRAARKAAKAAKRAAKKAARKAAKQAAKTAAEVADLK